VEQPVGRGRLIVLASDVCGQWNSFPRHAAFVPFVLETLRYLSGLKAHPAEVVVADVPSGTPARPGVARVGTPPRPVAVNVDVRESASARITPAGLTAAVRRVDPEGRGADAAARERESTQDLWRYILMVVALLLVAEGVLGHRRAPASATSGSETAPAPAVQA
jgi:hypothetical protein